MYAEKFRKQVYSSDAEQQTVKEALKIITVRFARFVHNLYTTN
jgi:hypothetical protein